MTSPTAASWTTARPTATTIERVCPVPAAATPAAASAPRRATAIAVLMRGCLRSRGSAGAAPDGSAAGGAADPRALPGDVGRPVEVELPDLRGGPGGRRCGIAGIAGSGLGEQVVHRGVVPVQDRLQLVPFGRAAVLPQ